MALLNGVPCYHLCDTTYIFEAHCFPCYGMHTTNGISKHCSAIPNITVQINMIWNGLVLIHTISSCVHVCIEYMQNTVPYEKNNG